MAFLSETVRVVVLRMWTRSVQIVYGVLYVYHRLRLAATQLRLRLLARKTGRVQRAHSETASIHALHLKWQTPLTWWDQTSCETKLIQTFTHKWFIVTQLLCAGLTPPSRCEKCSTSSCLTDHWSWGWLLWLRTWTRAGTFQLSVLVLFRFFWNAVPHHGFFASVSFRWMCSVTASRVWSCLRVDLLTLRLSCTMWWHSLTLLLW